LGFGLGKQGNLLAPKKPCSRQNRRTFRCLGEIQLRKLVISLAVAGVAMSIESMAVEAKELKPNDRYMCSWGAGTAARAQELKLQGVSLYAARQKIQSYKFSKTWMRMMAMGITEQTYDSRSRLKPEAIRQGFYQDCVRYKVARK